MSGRKYSVLFVRVTFRSCRLSVSLPYSTSESRYCRLSLCDADDVRIALHWDRGKKFPLVCDISISVDFGLSCCAFSFALCFEINKASAVNGKEREEKRGLVTDVIPSVFDR